MIEVLIADDQPLMRGALRMVIETQPDLRVAGEASDGREAVELAVRLRPDVAVLDIRMPKLDGLAATRELARLVPTRALILTTFDLDEYVTEALRAGASGFLLKTAPPEDIVAGIRVVAAGESLLAPTVTTRLLSRFRAATTPIDPARLAVLRTLTTRETEVLAGMARGASNTEIAAELHIGETTVKTHVSRILAKVGARDRVQAVIFAYESGLVTVGG
ncbi:response regulator [Catenuloplanes japonicus]|uniref:response regulator n=1 Tax=Catenuloplanes japonicus TaxID=33876 RepID=UPI000526726A|nr:response regulator transcription factor [Catenuloplanes japonicus]